jgi:putative membrane-bound dehydrogenase-like protein
MKCRSLVLLSLLTLATATAHAQVPPEKALSTFKVVDGLDWSLFASEPLFVNPTCMDVDHKGRVWVCDSINYRTKLHGRPLNRKEGDRIVILEDTTGTGKADKATVFYQSPEMLAPLGIAVAKDPVGPGYKVFVCQSPDILVFTDSKGVGKADGPPKKLLTGFGGHDHDHGVHGILIGPDMKLYFSVGDTGVKNLQSSDGKGRKWTSNNTDCRAGTIWRCDLDGKNLELIAHNFRNEYEPCVDSFGTVFVSDNDDDGNQQTRICYVMPGGDYGYHPRGKGETHWHEEKPGVVPKILRTYFGSPTGICVYEGTLLPKKYWGQLLHTDAGPRHLRCYHLTPNGASYDVEREDMVTSTDNWFRPSDVCVAPDGSVFVADWYDPGVGGHGMGDTTRGRIYRLTPKGYKGYKVPKVDLDSKKGILEALGSPALSVRYMAMAKIAEFANSEEERGRAKGIIDEAIDQKENEWLRVRGLWQLARLGFGKEFGEYTIAPLLKDKDPRFRILGHRLIELYSRPHGSIAAAKAAVNDRSAAVRREVLVLMRDMEPFLIKDILFDLAKQYDGKDRFYLEAIGIAVGHHDKHRRDILLANFDKRFPKLDERTLDLIWELRPPSVMPKLAEALADKDLNDMQHARIVDILAASDDKEAGKALLAVLQSPVPDAVRTRIGDNLKLYLPGKWRDLRTSKELDAVLKHLLSQAATRTLALELIGAAERTDAVQTVVGIAKTKDESPAVRVAAVRTLGQLPSAEVAAALSGLLDTKDAALLMEAIQSLGKLSQSRDNKAATVALTHLQTLAASKDRDLKHRLDAVGALASSRPGTIWLLDLHGKGELDPALKGEAGRLLRNSPYQDLRNKALIAFPPPGRLDLKKLPPIAELAQRRGDAAKGKALLVASAKNDMQCLKCHTIRGTGGQVGPDLSVIGKKASRENLFESILYPSKAIADQYINWIINTNKGQSINGLIVEEKPDYIVLRDANGKDTKIATKEIDTREKSKTSLMPDNIVVAMTEAELVDMVEYLFALKTPALGMDYWHIAGPFDNLADDKGLDEAYPPEKGVDLKATYDGKAGKVKWRTVKPDVQGYVDLQAFFAGQSDQIVSYSYREIESPVDQDATILLGTDDGGKLFVNDVPVYTSRTHRAAIAEQDAVKVKLKKGVNRLLLKVNNGDGAHGFYLTILAEQELKRVEMK